MGCPVGLGQVGIRGPRGLGVVTDSEYAFSCLLTSESELGALMLLSHAPLAGIQVRDRDSGPWWIHVLGNLAWL